jgi:hypothetical protein
MSPAAYAAAVGVNVAEDTKPIPVVGSGVVDVPIPAIIFSAAL